MKYMLFVSLLLIGRIGFAVTDNFEKICRNAFGNIRSDNSLVSALSVSERQFLFCQLRHELALSYAGIGLKKARQGIDVLGIVETCAITEGQFEDDEYSNIYFHDRIRQCLAKAEDSHLLAGGEVSRPSVYTGIELINIQNSFYIAAVDVDFIAANYSLDDRAKLLVGTKLTKFNGRDPELEIKNLEAFIADSSRESRRRKATRALLERDFLYPENNSANLELLSPAGQREQINVKFWVTGKIVGQNLRSYFTGLGIDHTSRGEPVSNFKINRTSVEKQGFLLEAPVYQPIQREYFSDQDKVGLRLAVQADEHNICYMQILTFVNQQWIEYIQVGNNKKVVTHDYLAPFTKFIKWCNQNNYNLVVDLRKNSGGAAIQDKLAALLLGESGKTGAMFFSGSVNFSLKQRMEFYNSPEFPDHMVNFPFSPRNRYLAFLDAETNGREYMDAVPYSEAITSSKDVGGFRQKKVVLITPECMSGCEILAEMLENVGAVLVGSSTNGTGLGYHGGDTVKWTSPLNFVEIKIPNFIFGVMGTSSYGEIEPLDFSLVRENNPLRADWYYTSSIEDVINDHSGWRDKVNQVLGSFNEINSK